MSIMRFVAPLCGCYIENWNVRYSEWDAPNSEGLATEVTAEGRVSDVALQRLRGDPGFVKSLGWASAAMTHEHTVEICEQDTEGGMWRPMGGRFFGEHGEYRYSTLGHRYSQRLPCAPIS